MFKKMVKYKIDGKLDVVFTILGPFLQTINIDRLILMTTIYYHHSLHIL